MMMMIHTNRSMIFRMECRLGEQERVRLRGLLVERDTLLAERNIELTDAQVPKPETREPQQIKTIF